MFDQRFAFHSSAAALAALAGPFVVAGSSHLAHHKPSREGAVSHHPTRDRRWDRRGPWVFWASPTTWRSKMPLRQRVFHFAVSGRSEFFSPVQHMDFAK